MVTKTPEGIDIQPLYAAEDWPWAGDPSGFPGFFPYVRGTDLIQRTRNGWDIRQEFREPDPKAANAEIKDELGREVTSVVLRLAGSAGEGGVVVQDLTGLDQTSSGRGLGEGSGDRRRGRAFLPAALALRALSGQAGRGE